MARYALVYTIAQDKSGLDVDNDSLLLKAYSYYDKRPTDTLYAKFQYYIGKYYMLNNRSEQAINCFKKAIASSKNNGDKYTQSLALEKLSKVIRTYSPLKAVAAAKEAAAIFSTLDDGSIDNMSRINTIYYKLNLSETLLFADSLESAYNQCNKALSLSFTTKDSNLISDSYQDMSVIQRKKTNYKQALYYAKKSYKFGYKTDESKLLNLAQAHVNVDSLIACNRTLKLIVQKVVEIKDNTRKTVTLSEGDWQEIRLLVDTIDDNFTIRLKDKFPDLSIEDINFMTLLRLKMSSKVMANIYGISEKSIRQKLFVYKSKVGIENRKDISLRNFIEQF